MIHSDVLIIGGGPAGSSAARRLKQGGADVLILDKELFPRLKLCAGWITPDVVKDLDMDIAAYPYRFLTFGRMHAYLRGVHLPLPCVQHSIRRFEFDAWLLERSGVRCVQHTVRHIEADPAGGYMRRWRVPLQVSDRRGRHPLPGVPDLVPRRQPARHAAADRDPRARIRLRLARPGLPSVVL